MSRSGYTDELDQGQPAMWRGAVRSAITGKRGQAFLRELLAALDTMPDKKLIEHDLRDATGQVCTLGSIGVARQVDLEKLDPEDHETLSATFNIAEALVRKSPRDIRITCGAEVSHLGRRDSDGAPTLAT